MSRFVYSSGGLGHLVGCDKEVQQPRLKSEGTCATLVLGTGDTERGERDNGIMIHSSDQGTLVLHRRGGARWNFELVASEAQIQFHRESTYGLTIILSVMEAESVRQPPSN